MAQGSNNIDPAARYMESHEWTRPSLQKGSWDFETGISAHAEAALGEVVFVELPDPGTALKAGEVFGVVESVKAASDLYMPLSGTIVEVNTRLGTEPGLVNADCYGEGWLLRIKADDPEDFETLLSPTEYADIF